MKVLTHYLLWKLGLTHAWTFYNEAECEALERYAAGKKRLAEIGCWQGVNTARLRKTMSPQGILFAVDPYSAGRLGISFPQMIAHSEAGKISNGTLCWVRKTDLEAAEIFKLNHEPPVDFIFSDSHNSYDGFRKTWEAWSPLIASGGIYILANSLPVKGRGAEEAGSVRFTREEILKDTRFLLIEEVGSFTVLKRAEK